MSLTLNAREHTRDPYKNRQRFDKWKRARALRVQTDAGTRELLGPSRDAILAYLEDLEVGVNSHPSIRKGARSSVHLNTVRVRLARLAWLSQNVLGKDLPHLGERDAAVLFHKMRAGEVLSRHGKQYQSVADFVKTFKAYWHWHMRASTKQGIQVPDITLDLDATPDHKPPFVYFTIDELKRLCAHANRKMRVMMLTMFDSGIRSPTELVNLKGGDVSKHAKGWVELQIRDETSKTFGRKIKLLLAGEAVLDWIAERKIGPGDFIFEFHPAVANRYLKRLGARVFPDGGGKGTMTLGRKRFDQLTLYDFRHSACCYWLPRYKSESALKYRFGWKKGAMIHYYSELLGMRDTIDQDDLIDTDTKADLERQLERERQEAALLHERLDFQNRTEATRKPADDLMTSLLRDEHVRDAIKEALRRLHENRPPRTPAPAEARRVPAPIPEGSC